MFSAACVKQAVLRALQLVPSCHPRWESVEKGRKHREHGAHGKDWKPDDLNTLFMIQNYLPTRCLKTLYFTAFMATVEKVISYLENMILRQLKMDKQMRDKNKRDSRQRKAKKKLRRQLFQYLSFLDMHIIHRKVLKWISAKKNSYTQLLCLQIISKNSNYLCLWQWEAIIHNGPLLSPALFHSFLDKRKEIDILVRNTQF